MPAPARVFVVEDDPHTSQRFQNLIDPLPDFEWAGASATAGEALRWLAAHTPDVLLVDLGLPDQSGIDVVREAARRHPNCEIMVITMFGDEAHVVESLRAGAGGYLLKDANLDDLAHHLRELRAGGSPITPVIARNLLKTFRRDLAWPDPGQWRSAAAAPRPASSATDLSDREMEVLQHIAKGFANAEIADLLNVSTHTVGTYVKRIYGKLAVNSRTEAVYEARQSGLINGD